MYASVFWIVLGLAEWVSMDLLINLRFRSIGLDFDNQ
jgi:hypothetical protein